ncbi:nickel pincer cofactor biosynthesis protein LarC [Pseudonocardia sp. KRD-184]|uniref:Pyridinium-3,5-bisthiocarboxylic acid mononucleotide nickel insertion protein n=1 Tax=Pseudonocardia oceani TaxID=2792013 RepID=A0ABS6U807_9PSEU|nr:nickel pincer cofactor biosynthesis protein LarC [Pseudonocardia oceani]MBW0089458.1 nickel pincer cofactor biosynthesis protein LarC [Pseudonocardia oceani]MBW0096464.1 nickel pincer cofactor biosynthesis protein LarC [Pseudonocardia oceani]MBW0109158.1 nickel pincer cofactor biosynthesis protein LarC [Pseudonocardia oceani]MBW0120689.1 nickel pincer cofactor biosynthesis protein LarC [Pseudonocardia oceani]MBW0128377.1 nickel pincer cofactor biosynthesis protein LarC [Pseudonocardia ocean
MIVWLNPVGGVSGDMLLGALIGLGAPVDGVRQAVASTGLTGWDLEVTDVRRGALRATRATVRVEAQPPERRAADLLEIVSRARPAGVAATARRAITAIAEVESRLHGVPVDQVHLHEIGGVDTVVDTVGVAAALALLDVDAVRCGPLPMGTGTVRTAHGIIPLPAPATAALVAAAGAPVTAGGDRETVTPTGMALLLALGTRFGPVPDMTVSAVGYGAGGRDDPGRANVVQALLGTAPDPGTPGEVTPMTLLETTVDDVSGEVLGHVLDRALAAGAADAWITPVTMKKSRPGHTVHLLVTPERAAACETLLLRETGSLGVRRRTVDRRALPRRTSTVDVGGHVVRVKHGPWGAKPEHDDLVAAAAALDLPLREVAARAARAVT